MNAGKLNRRVRLETSTRTSDALGGGPVVWNLFADGVAAAVVPLTGRERIAAMQVSAALTHRVEIRYRPGLSEAMRVVYGGRVFNVTAVIDIEERHDEVHLLCEEAR